MASWLDPTLTSLYADVLDDFHAKAKAVATMFNDGVTWTDLDTNTIKWNDSSTRFEKWNGSAWVNLSTALTDVCKTANNLSDLASASTARTNLGLGSMAVVNSPAPIANGGTGATTDSGARTALGLGSIATQAASAVAITGGTLSGVTALTMTSGSTLSMTSNGTISAVGVIQNAAAMTIQTTGGAYSISLRTNSVERVAISAVGLAPGSTNTYDLGSSGTIWRDIFADRINSGKIDHTSDINFRFSAVAYFLMNASTKAFSPTTDNLQALGSTSAYWQYNYCNSIRSPNNAINLYDSSDHHIRYISGTSGTHKFFNAAGATQLYEIEATGKLNPVAVGRQDYSFGYSPTLTRTLNSGSGNAADVNHIRDVLATVITDLIAHGLYQ